MHDRFEATRRFMLALPVFLAGSRLGWAQGATSPAVGGPLTPDEKKPLASRVPIKIGYSPSIAQAACFVANEFGYYKSEGLDVEMEIQPNSQAALVLLAQGRIDAITGAFSAAVLNAIAGGINVRIVSGMSNIAPVPGVNEVSPSGFFVRKTAADTIKEYKDLKGKSVGTVGGMGGAVSYLLSLYAAKGGFALQDVTMESFSNADALMALKSGRIDAAYLTAPYSIEAARQGIAVELGNARDVYGDETTACTLFGPTLLEKNRQAGVAYMRAMVKAVRERLQGDYRKRPDVVAALAKAAGAEPETIRALPLYNMSLNFKPATALQMQKTFMRIPGTLSYSNLLSIDQIVQLQFLEAASET